MPGGTPPSDWTIMLRPLNASRTKSLHFRIMRMPFFGNQKRLFGCKMKRARRLRILSQDDG